MTESQKRVQMLEVVFEAIKEAGDIVTIQETLEVLIVPTALLDITIENLRERVSAV